MSCDTVTLTDGEDVRIEDAQDVILRDDSAGAPAVIENDTTSGIEVVDSEQRINIGCDGGGGGGSTIRNVAYDEDDTLVDETHNIGRYPLVQVLSYRGGVNADGVNDGGVNWTDNIGILDVEVEHVSVNQFRFVNRGGHHEGLVVYG